MDNKIFAKITLIIGIIGLVVPIIPMFISISSFAKLGKGGDAIEALTYLMCSGIFVGIPNGLAIWLSTIVEDYSNIILAIAVGVNTALMVATGGLGTLLKAFSMVVLEGIYQISKLLFG